MIVLIPRKEVRHARDIDPDHDCFIGNQLNIAQAREWSEWVACHIVHAIKINALNFRGSHQG